MLTQVPHQAAKELLPRERNFILAMQNFSGMVEYLASWRWSADAADVICSAGVTAAPTRFLAQAHLSAE